MMNTKPVYRGLGIYSPTVDRVTLQFNLSCTTTGEDSAMKLLILLGLVLPGESFFVAVNSVHTTSSLYRQT